MKLVIVESPAKAKTIAKYLGGEYTVDASGGHIRDLPEKKLGVDIKNNFLPQYEINSDKKEVIKRLKAKSAKAEEVYLATDPDREGEAISWHLSEALSLNEIKRIEFNEISKAAVSKAIKNPREINMRLVDAQQARRVLDRLVGYMLSPVLCKKISGKLSAGRVQSAALKLLVEREREILAFVPVEYWNISALLNKKGNELVFKALLAEKNGKKLTVKNKEQADAVLEDIKGKPFIVSDVKKSISLSNPQPPFTTSTMQQDASVKLGLQASVTMQLAQQLYEGVDISGDHTALVTYIRTDSVRVSGEAMATAKEYIVDHFGEEYVPEKPNIYKSRKDSQDAHEAIRPINLELTPFSLKDKLPKNLFRLYKLIYERFLASQSTPAKFDSVSVTIKAGVYGFKANGKTLIFDGYTRIYNSENENPDIKDKEKEKDKEDIVKLPPLSEGEELNLKDILSEQKFTKPPARFTESSLIKLMEENGIGRPSTYSATLATLYKRSYCSKEGKSLVPSKLGCTVVDYLEANFASIVDVEFTAQMEDKLDTVEDGADWQALVTEFYGPFNAKIVQASGDKNQIEIETEPSDVTCDKCGAMMIYKMGRYGKYLACPNYPECKNIRSLKAAAAVATDKKCEKCGAVMMEKTGKYGKYLSCSNYPECKNTSNLNEIVAKCPNCGGDVAKRFSKKGKMFYGCVNYPNCKFVSWDVPANEKCEKCGSYMTVNEKAGDVKHICSNANCKHSVLVDAGDK